MTVPSKRLRGASFTEKHHEHSESHGADWLPEKEMAQVQFDNFLEQCRFCKNNLRHDEDIYMYGYLGAFCSKKCRAKQMVCDIFKESLRDKAKAKMGRTSKKSKDEALGNQEMITTSTSQFYI